MSSTISGGSPIIINDATLLVMGYALDLCPERGTLRWASETVVSRLLPHGKVETSSCRGLHWKMWSYALSKEELSVSAPVNKLPGDSARFPRDHSLSFEGEDSLFYTGSEGSPEMQGKVVVLLSPARNVGSVSPSDSIRLSEGHSFGSGRRETCCEDGCVINRLNCVRGQVCEMIMANSLPAPPHKRVRTDDSSPGV